jgi:hypothetical protein
MCKERESKGVGEARGSPIDAKRFIQLHWEKITDRSKSSSHHTFIVYTFTTYENKCCSKIESSGHWERNQNPMLREQGGTTTSILHFVVSTDVSFGNFDQINQWASK